MASEFLIRVRPLESGYMATCQERRVLPVVIYTAKASTLLGACLAALVEVHLPTVEGQDGQ